MKLTDLDVDCLEAILEHLHFEDFVRVADSNKRLQHAARFVYARKYRRWDCFQMKHPMKWREQYRRDRLLYTVWDGRQVIVYNYKFGLQILRCFGHQFRTINYQKDGYSDEWDRFYVEYLNEMCGETVKFFIIQHCYDSFLRNFTKPFNGVNRVLIRKSRIDLHPAKDIFVRIFPNMQMLDLNTECFPLEESMCIANHNPHLETLFIEIGECYQCECTNVIVSTLRLNPQLKKLVLSKFGESDVPLIQTMNEYNKNLEYFKIDLSRSFFTVNYDGTIWHLEHVKWLNVDTELYDNYYYPYIIPFSFNQLEKLDITLKNPFTDHFYNFCVQNRSLKCLFIRCTYEAYEFLIYDSVKITAAIPFLEELEVVGIQIDKAIDIINAFNHHKPLKSVKFRLFHKFVRQPISYLRLNLTEGWSIFSIEEHLFKYRLVTVRRQTLSNEN